MLSQSLDRRIFRIISLDYLIHLVPIIDVRFEPILFNMQDSMITPHNFCLMVLVLLSLEPLPLPFSGYLLLVASHHISLLFLWPVHEVHRLLAWHPHHIFILFVLWVQSSFGRLVSHMNLHIMIVHVIHFLLVHCTQELPVYVIGFCVILVETSH